ncbi:hypothetical protein D3C80_1828420 [compost metagenome]
MVYVWRKYKVCVLKILILIGFFYVLSVKAIKHVLYLLVQKPKMQSCNGYKFIPFGMVILLLRLMYLLPKKAIRWVHDKLKIG